MRSWAWGGAFAIAGIGACQSPSMGERSPDGSWGTDAPGDASVGDDDAPGESETEGGGEDATDDATGGGSPGDVLHMQLAGHALAASPWFRTVDNFDDHESVELAIDPRRVPELEGTTCDAWVVAARDANGWSNDPELVDVRAGGPQAITLVGDLSAARVELAAAGGLPSDAGAGLGVGYDVVLDCNRNGLLDIGDVIDGGDAPGLWRTHDITQPGPLEVAMLEVSGGTFLGQRTFYPAAIGRMDALPLVVVTHGWSYEYTHYDYIGQHLASYGYVVMVHEANVQDGGPAATHAAATTTLENTEYLLANLATIGGGVLDGHVDGHRIMWSGHSTGGEAVVRALTQLREGSFSSPWYGAEDIAVLSSLAPVSWHPRTVVDPGDVPYHMVLAGADDDVSGAPIASYTQPRSIFERATGPRQLTYIHGAGHGDLVSCCGPAFLDTGAPDLIGREVTNVVARGYFLALAELYLRDNEAAREYFARPFHDYHPPGIEPHVVVTGEYHPPRDGVIVLDDFETSSGAAADPLHASSSGGIVTFDVANAAEVLMQDNDGSLAWTGTQPANGMTHARHVGDDPHALVFDFAPDAARFWEHEVPADLRDFGGAQVLSFRACQGTRHPETVALAGSLSFTVSLRDESGRVASLGLAGIAEIPPPYARMGEGTGAGWQNELTTVRLRLTDFLGAEPALDLRHIEAVRMDFGTRFGSSRGRVGLDDLELQP
jgi:dienelactone hydrolase